MKERTNVTQVMEYRQLMGISELMHPISIHDRCEGEVGHMQLIGYCIHGNKQYVAYRDKEDLDQYKITDGFRDKQINKGNAEKYKDYKWVDLQNVDLKKIISRMHGARPWHPLLKLFRKESES